MIRIFLWRLGLLVMLAAPADVLAQSAVVHSENAVARFVEDGNRSLSEGNALAAAENYRKAIEINPRDPKVH